MSGKSDFFPGVTMPQLKDVKNQAPQAVCQIFSANVGRNLLVNRGAPPFDNPDLRRAMSLSLDRKSFIDIITAGEGENRGGDAAVAERALGDAGRHAEDVAGV